MTTLPSTITAPAPTTAPPALTAASIAFANEQCTIAAANARLERTALRYIAALIRDEHPEAATLAFWWGRDDTMKVTGANTARGRALKVTCFEKMRDAAARVHRNGTSWIYLVDTEEDAARGEFDIETLLALPAECTGELATPEAEEMFFEIYSGSRGGSSNDAIYNHLTSLEESLRGLRARTVTPRSIVGTGYTNSRKVAVEWLEGEIRRARIGLATDGRSNAVNRSNVRSGIRAARNIEQFSRAYLKEAPEHEPTDANIAHVFALDAIRPTKYIYEGIRAAVNAAR